MDEAEEMPRDELADRRIRRESESIRAAGGGVDAGGLYHDGAGGLYVGGLRLPVVARASGWPFPILFDQFGRIIWR